MEETSISFLLGAGFSVPMGYPTANGLNEMLLNCNNISISRNGELVTKKFDFGDANSYTEYFDFCKVLMLYYNDKVKPFDYEEFYDYYENKDSKTDKSLIKLFNSRIYDNGNANFDYYYSKIDDIYNQLIFLYLEDEGKKFCSNKSLHYNTSYKNFLDYIETYSKDSIINVHTLNHDLLFEQLCDSKCINHRMSDGFDKSNSPYYTDLEGEACKYQLEQYTGVYNNKLRLYKLHGSLNYYRCYVQNKNIIDEVYLKKGYGIGIDYFYKKEDKEGDLSYIPWLINDHPDFLTGTTFKILRYKELLYKRLLEHFEENLKKAQKLVIIGYGCKDSEINRIIVECYGKDKPCYIVDPFPSDQINDFISTMGSNTKLIQKNLEHLDIADM